MKSIRKHIAFLLGLVVALSLFGCAPSPEAVQAQFDAFLEEEFAQSLSSDYLSMHIFTVHPENYGVDREKVPVNLGLRTTLENKAAQREELAKSIKKLKSFPREQLTPIQQDTYDVYLMALQSRQNLCQEKFDYFDDSFSDSGIYTSLPTIFADYRVRSEEDIADLITLIADTRSYLQSCLDFAKLQQQKGTLSINCETVLEYCRGILEEGEQSAVLGGMLQTIEAFPLEEEAKREYKRQLTQAFVTCFLPAYQDIVDAVTELQAEGAEVKPLADMPNGKQYYAALLQYKLGTTASVEEISAEIQAFFAKTYGEMEEILQNPDVLERYFSAELTTNYSDFPTILSDLEKMIAQDFPDIGQVNYSIDPLAPALAVSSVAAYFNLPALDGDEPLTIKVNTTNGYSQMNSLDIFSTVAHEGFPGHLYQNAYVRKYLAGQPLRQLFTGCDGYAEGYAKYVELLSPQYLDLDPQLVELWRINSLLMQCYVVWMDIGIHYEGWSEAQCNQLREMLGLGEEGMDDFLAQLSGNPGVFLSYYVGSMAFFNLREQAEQALGQRFHLKAFHEEILRYGDVPLDFLKTKVRDYIALQSEEDAA